MFSKSSEGAAETGGAATGGRSVLGADLVIKGNLTSTGTVEVHGRHEGDIEARNLVIGGDGKVSGKVRAESVEIKGQLSGSASCLNLTLRSSAKVKANVTYDRVVIESGAEVEGKFKHAPSKPAA